MLYDQKEIGLLLLVGIVGLFTALFIYVLSRYLLIKRRLHEDPNKPESLLEADDIADLSFDKNKYAKGMLSSIEKWTGNYLNTPQSAGKLRQKLMRAGIYDPRAVNIFLAARLIFAVVLPVGLALFLYFIVRDVPPTIFFFLPLSVSILGLVLPDYYVSRCTTTLQDECRQGFPDFLDLLVVATDAGLSLEAAFGRVGPEIVKNFPLLGANIHMMSLEMRLGKSFQDSLDSLVERTNVEEISAFATLLQQSRELGSSVTQALKIYSDDMRHKRLSRAEEKAHALPVKLVAPLGIFLFPLMILIVMLPVALRIKASFLSGG